MKPANHLLVAFATTLIPNLAFGAFVYNDFSDVTGLQINGDATQDGNLLRLTPAVDFTSGSVFTTNQIPLGTLSSFSTYFRFQMLDAAGIGDEDGIGADGLVFVVQTVSNSVGSAGGGIGYQGITPSLGIEFDTYNNEAHDPGGNHVGINSNGNIASLATVVEPIRFNDGQVWNAWIDYDGSVNSLEVRWSLDNNRPLLSQLSSLIDLQGIFGQNTGFVGFTSATGGGRETHDILSWEFRDEFSPVPEPSGLLLSGLSILLFGTTRRRRGE